MMTRLSRNEFESILRSIGEAEYHNNHPYHVRMYRGQCSIDEIRAWALNRFCYQRIIPAKDALVMARLDDIEDRVEGSDWTPSNTAMYICFIASWYTLRDS